MDCHLATLTSLINAVATESKDKFVCPADPCTVCPSNGEEFFYDEADSSSMGGSLSFEGPSGKGSRFYSITGTADGAAQTVCSFPPSCKVVSGWSPLGNELQAAHIMEEVQIERCIKEEVRLIGEDTTVDDGVNVASANSLGRDVPRRMLKLQVSDAAGEGCLAFVSDAQVSQFPSKPTGEWSRLATATLVSSRLVRLRGFASAPASARAMICQACSCDESDYEKYEADPGHGDDDDDDEELGAADRWSTLASGIVRQAVADVVIAYIGGHFYHVAAGHRLRRTAFIVWQFLTRRRRKRQSEDRVTTTTVPPSALG